jgi:hypothetical protein
MIVFGLIAALFTIFISGLGMTMSIFARGGGRINLIECACLAWLSGAGIVSLLLWICGMFCSGFILQILVTIACLVVAILGWRAKQHLNATLTLPRPANISEWILASIVLIEITVLVFVSFKHTLGWDGLLNWEIKARYAFLNGGVMPVSYYSSAGRSFSHPEYPLGIPFTELWLYLWMGEPNQFWVKTVFASFFAVGVIMLALVVARLSAKRWAGMVVAILLPFVPYLLSGPGGVATAYADFPLSVQYLAALGYLLLWFKSNDSRFLIVFAVCCTLLLWTKSEGIILWLVLVLLGFVLSSRKRRFAPLVFSIVPGCALILAWRVYLNLIHLWPHSDFARPSLSLLGHNLNRLGEIFAILFVELSQRTQWSIFWLLVAMAVVCLFASRKIDRIAVAGAIIGPILLYSLTYVFSAWPSYTAHMTSSFPRLLLHVMPAGWLAIGLALSQPKRETQTL